MKDGNVSTEQALSEQEIAERRNALSPVPATQLKTCRCNRNTAGGGNGFCKKHLHHIVHRDGLEVKRHGRPDGEMPFDPSSSQFCRALVGRYVVHA